MKDSTEMKDILLQIKLLEQKKAALNDAAEIKVINKQINALQEKYGQLREQRKNMKAFAESVFREFNSIECTDDDELDEDQKLFYKLADQGAEIPAYKAMRLLGCLALDKEKANMEQRTVAYHAGNSWLRDYITNDPLKTFEGITFFDIMKFLCPEYYDKYWDSFKLESIDDETADKCTYQLMRTIDSETAQALCHGVWLGYL